MRYPEFLKTSNTIGFVAPSFGCAREPYFSAFKGAQAFFESNGYGLDIGPNCYVEKGIGISNTPEACGRELTDSYISNRNDIIISCGGGELMCETLNYTDYDAIKAAKPKWYMGYSDNTNFTYLSTTICDTAAIYGPCISSFGMKPHHASITDAFLLLKGEKLTFSGYDGWELESLKDEENPFVPYNITEKTIIKKYLPSASEPSNEDIVMSGRLLGGCIDCLINLIGTEFDKTTEFIQKYSEDGILWFLEACELSPLDVRRAMWHMKNAGWFKFCSGFIIGRPGEYGAEIMGLDHYHAVVDILKEYNVPIIMDADIGHHSPMIPVISGAIGELSTSGNDYKLSFRLE